MLYMEDLERYLKELQDEFPEVDAFVRIKDNEEIVKTIMSLYSVNEKSKYRSGMRILTNPNHYAYLKIADGCNNGCAYCTIPRIRGRYNR